MSYNTRRGRGGLNSNFVSGGQFQSNMKPGVQMGQQQQNRQVGANQQSYAQQNVNKPVYQTSVQPQMKSALKPVQTTPQTYQTQQIQQQQQQQQMKQEVKTPQKPQVAPIQQQQQQQQQMQMAQAAIQALQSVQQDIYQQQVKDESMDTSTTDDDQTNGNGKKKTPWKPKTGAALSIQSGKISKKEKRGRRNQRLRKILQPKNALMVLNEIVGGQKFTVSDAPMTGDENFVASVTVDGQDFIGNGKSKTAAKTAAAEQALKNILLRKLKKTQNEKLLAQNQNELISDDIPMTDETEKQQNEDDVSWLHVASYAIHKLFDSWDAEGILNESIGNSIEIKDALTGVTIRKPVTKKPAKQLPSNAELMNPVMLLNQMRPGVVYEDFQKEGTSPNITFTIRAQIDGQEFFGKGTNKKLARRNCAFEACKKLFTITYPPQDVAASV